jgi:hypothetical protein
MSGAPNYTHVDYEKDRHIQILQDQIYWHRKRQEENDVQLQSLYERIDELEHRISNVTCFKCHCRALQQPSRVVCEGCVVVQENSEPVVAESTRNYRLEGPACEACRFRKRRCDRQRPHCSFCVGLHKNMEGEPNCVYTSFQPRKPPLKPPGSAHSRHTGSSDSSYEEPIDL